MSEILPSSVPASPYYSAAENLPPPLVSLSITIDPPVYSAACPELPTLGLHVTSHASRPITICTDGTVLNLGQAMRGRNFNILDLTANQRVWTFRGHVRRAALRRRFGVSAEKYYLTLYPEKVTTIAHPFVLAGTWNTRDPEKGLVMKPRSSCYKGEEFRNYLEPNHKYRFGISDDQGIGWWRYGTKEEVLEPADSPPPRSGQGWSEPQITFTGVQDVEFYMKD